VITIRDAHRRMLEVAPTRLADIWNTLVYLLECPQTFNWMTRSTK